MIVKSILLFLCCFCCLFVIGQVILKGKITADSSGTPVIGASVFLSNSSYGTVTNSSGDFTLSIPNGRYDLVITSIGFESYNESINTQSLPGIIAIKLNRRSAILDAVTVRAYEKDGWQKWGRFFLENFIGTSELATDCEIVNFKEVKFTHDKKAGKLTAYAFEPLVIVNKALGYSITYDLKQFEYNFKSRIFIFAGAALFKQLDGRPAQIRRWEERRKETYYGGIMHFMRSLYRNRIAEEGYDLRFLVKKLNYERQRVQSILRSRAFITPGKIVSISTPNPNLQPDSSDYYQKIMEQPEELITMLPVIVTGDSIAYSIDSFTAAFEFPNYLLIHYKHKNLPEAYRNTLGANASGAMLSELFLMNGGPVQVFSNGSMYPPTELLTLGYWAWHEKLSALLPLDYKPPAGK